MATVHLSPAWIRSEFQSPSIGPLGHLEGAPRFVKRGLSWLMDRRVFDPLFTVPLNALRAEHGLPPVQRTFHRWVHEADLTLATFPAWFARPQPDWPAGLQMTGFPLYDHGGEIGLPAEVEAFLGAGEAPVAFTAGTANAASHAFFEASVRACERSGRRGLLLTQDASQLPATLPPTVAHFRYVPFGALLPRLSAIVHHGGIGTTSQALLAAGVRRLDARVGGRPVLAWAWRIQPSITCAAIQTMSADSAHIRSDDSTETWLEDMPGVVKPPSGRPWGRDNTHHRTPRGSTFGKKRVGLPRIAT